MSEKPFLSNDAYNLQQKLHNFKALDFPTPRKIKIPLKLPPSISFFFFTVSNGTRKKNQIKVNDRQHERQKT
jgi:hypothetical protein